MAEAVRIKKTKTKSHKSKTKDKESSSSVTKDVETSDISEDATRHNLLPALGTSSVSIEGNTVDEAVQDVAFEKDEKAEEKCVAENQTVREEISQDGTAEKIDTVANVATNLSNIGDITDCTYSESGETTCPVTTETNVGERMCSTALEGDLTVQEDSSNLQKVADGNINTSEISTFPLESTVTYNETAAASTDIPEAITNIADTDAKTFTQLKDDRTVTQQIGQLHVSPVESSVIASAPEEIVSMETTVGITSTSETAVTSSDHLKLSVTETSTSPVIHRKLYPCLNMEAAAPLRPFTDEQLRTLYYNNELEHVDDYIEAFLQKANQDRHEFHEIVRSYYRARNHLAGAELDIDSLQKAAKEHQDLVWEFVTEKISVSGFCQDKYKVVGDLVSERAVYRAEASSQLDRTLKAIRNQIHDDLSLYAYEAQLSRLQVESYLSRLYSAHPALTDIPPNYPIQAFLAHQRDPLVTQQVEELKVCISVLFTFQRKPTKDDVFVKDVRNWLSILVGTLLRLATLEDHLFILNHVLRCPAGVAKWAVSFIQPVLPSVPSQQTVWGGPLLDHFTTMLALILLPVRQREDLLHNIKISLSAATENTTDGQWIIVDSDGEEDEDPNNSWHYFQENDVVSLLNQFPLYQIFDHILMVRNDQGTSKYDVSRVSETSLLKFFAYATCLIRLLGRGLQNFTLGRYRQLNKRIGRMIRHIVQYTCDHWANFKSEYVGLTLAVMERLQLELDMVVQKAVTCILSAYRLGSWQFLAELPYKCVSMPVLWNLFRIMHQGCSKTNSSLINADLAVELCKLELTDPANQAEFHDRLTRLQTSEALFLLNTFANMARSRPECDMDFVEFVSGEIHEIAYVSSHTREFCSKPGRELLETICSRHPSIISFLLRCTKANMDKIGVVSHFLYRGLPLHLWHPTEADIVTLRQWLLEHNTSSAENQLARILIEHMNWSFNSTGNELFLDLSLHQQMAALLMDVCSTYLAGKNLGKLFIDGQKQLSPTGKVAANDDHQLANWIWSTALRLHLHSRSLSQTGSLLRDDVNYDSVVDLATNTDLHSIVSGLLSESRLSLASYFVLVMTECGQRISEILSEGLQHLSHLVEKSYFIPAIQCIYYITPMFFEDLVYLTSNSAFMQCIQMILQSDSSRKSYFSFDSSRPVAHTFSCMIESQMAAARTDGKPVRVIALFWLRILTQLTNWTKEREVIFVLDNIIKSSFCDPEAFDRVQDLFLELTKSYSREASTGFLSSIASWLGSGGKVQSLMEQTSSSEFVWFAFVVLSAESYHLEKESELWLEVQQELITNPSITVDQAMSKAVSNLKLDNSFTTACLGIYRWANQAVDSPINHPLLPMLWQRFMLAYLGRCVIGTGLPQRGSVGDRFFASSAHISLMKRMKKRLKESADHYYQILSSSNSDQSQVPALSPEASALYEKLVRLFLTLSFWLDEPRLHNSELYIPALPEQYQGPLLVTIFQGQTEPWRNLVDTELISRDLEVFSKEWSVHLIQPWPGSKQEQGSRVVIQDEETSFETLLSRLERNRTEVVSPPPVQTPKSSVPDINPRLLLDKQNLLYTLRVDFQCVVDHAKLFAIRVSKHVDLDCSFIELLQKLFVNVLTEGVVNVPCRSAFNPAHRCKGPAVISCLYENRKKDDIVNRRIEENRASSKQLLIESLLTPPQNLCCAAIRIENAITGLVNLHRATEDKSVKEQLVNVGTAVFYVMTSYVSDETKFYPPTRQLYSSCIEVLGQEFIRKNPAQSQALLQTILQTPSLVGLLAPNFCPNANPELFVAMYEDMANVPTCQGVDVAFSLLTKFDVLQWLESNRPVLSRRTSLINCIIESICLCGQEPNASIKIIYQLYRVHLQQLLRYQFPDHFGYILKLLLKGSLDGRLCPSVWKDFLTCLDSKQRSNSLEGVGLGQSTLSAHCILPRQQIKECMEFLSSYFFRLRVSSDNTVTYGLYPNWNPYVPHLVQLMSHLAAGNIRTSDQSTQQQRFGDNEQVVGDLFRQIMDLFAPWVLPLNNNGQILLPWTLNDTSMGSDMVSAWVDSVDLLHRTFEGNLPALSKNALSLLWSEYVSSFTIKSLPDHLLCVIHDRLVLLPWVKFFPDLQAVELMMKVIDYSKSCFEFLGKIFTLLDWPSIMKFYCSHELREITLRLHVCIFTLLVHLAHDPTIVENTRLPQLLSSDIFDWNYLDGQSYQSAVNWFINVCQPQCIMLEKTASGSQILTLLKKAASFHPKPAVDAHEHPEAPVKRCSYVRCLVQLICRSSFLKDVRSEALGIVLNNLMTEVEGVVASISDQHCQLQEALVLSAEVLCLFNNCNPQSNILADMLHMALQWIGSSPISVLLMPLMTSACRCLASTTHMVVVIEACIDTHFSIDVSQTDGFGWTKVLSVLQVPELNTVEFLKASVQQGSYLTLYAYILQKLPLSQSLNDELGHLNQVLEWNTNAKPSAENESKMFLWWHKILELSLRQIDFGGEKRNVVKVLLTFVSTLITLGEDKSSLGLLGALGLGKKSSLSLRFRLVAKGLAAYISAQIPNDLSLRLDGSAPGHVSTRRLSSPPGSPSTTSPSQQAIQTLAHLDSLKTNKQYAGFKQHIDLLISITFDPNNCFSNVIPVLTRFVSPLFPEIVYLEVIRHIPLQ